MPVSLPSIHEMFPEHMMASWLPPHDAPPPLASSSSLPPLSPPRAASLKLPVPPLALPSPHEAKLFDERARPAFRVQIPAPAVYVHAPADAGAYRPREPASAGGEEKKHCCPHCHKRFNRPSSLNIHVNTHTGAKPFQCPYPGCHRKFNVNSNMRRHWRNHVTTSRRRDAVARLVAPASGPPTPSAARAGAEGVLSPAGMEGVLSPAGSAYSLPSSLSSASSTRSADSRSPSPPPPPPSAWPAGEEGLRRLAAVASAHAYREARCGEDEDEDGGMERERAGGRTRSRSSPAPAPVRCEEGRARARSCVLPGCGCRR